MPKTTAKQKQKAQQPKKVPLVIKLLGIFLAGLIGAVSGFYSFNIIGTQFLFLRSAVLFVTGVLSFVLAYGLWKGSRWSWWFGVFISLALMFATLISFNITDLFIGLLLFCGLTQGKTRTYFHLEAQSAIEYLISYSWAIMLICIAVALLYLYVLPAPAQVVPNLCNFVNGVYCNDVVIFNTTQNNNTLTIATVLINSNQYPILLPKIYASYQGQNTTEFSCTPGDKVAPGSSTLCIASITVPGASAGSLVGGNMYLNAQACTSASCSQSLNETYSGSFTSHVQPAANPVGFSFQFLPKNYDEPIYTNDTLFATITLFGIPLKDAYVNFTTNSSSYKILNTSLTGTDGIATADLYGTQTGNVAVTADYLGISNTITVYYYNSIATTTTTSTTSTVTTIPQVPEIMLNMSPPSASSYWNVCAQYRSGTSGTKIKDCVGYNGISNPANATIPVPANSAITAICTTYPGSGAGNYLFNNWSQETGVPSYDGSECSSSTDIPIIGPYYIGGNYKLESSNVVTVPVTVSIASSNSIATAKNWSASIIYTVAGSSSQEGVTAGTVSSTDINPVTNTTYIPIGSSIVSVCIKSYGGSNYGFVDWSGSYSSNVGCPSGLGITVNSAYSVNANFELINGNSLTIPITLEMNPAGADNNWGACIVYTLSGFDYPTPEECVGNVLGFSGSENIIYVNSNTALQTICTYNNTLGPGNYGFTGWTGGFSADAQCSTGSGKITKAHTVIASYNTISSNIPTVPLTLNETPFNSSNYYDLCVQYYYTGFVSNEPQECVGSGNGFSGATNVIAVPTNSVINYICLYNNSLGTGSYVFANWFGSYSQSSAVKCDSSLDIPVNAAYLVQANFTGGAPYGSTSTSTTSSTTSTSASSSTSIPTLYTLKMECSGPVYSNCGISPTGGLQYDYPAGSKVTINAPSTTTSTSACSFGTSDLLGWTGDGGGYTGNSLTANIFISNNIVETAYYVCG